MTNLSLSIPNEVRDLGVNTEISRAAFWLVDCVARNGFQVSSTKYPNPKLTRETIKRNQYFPGQINSRLDKWNCEIAIAINQTENISHSGENFCPKNCQKLASDPIVKISIKKICI